MTEYSKVVLGTFFSRTKNREEFTDDSLIYQKIFAFSLLGVDHHSFTRWKICRWLKDNYQPFENRSVVSLQQLIARKIDILLQLKLIVEIGAQPIEKGTGQTPIYAFGSTSYFLGWLMESLSSDPTRKNKAIQSIYNILYLMLETDTPSSMSIFLKLLFRKIKESGIFTHLVEGMTELLESGNSIKDISDLVNQTLLFRHSLNFVNKYNELWQGTLNELEPQTRQLVMFRIKLLYEQRIKERAYYPAEFENVRFSARKEFDKIVLECSCLSCHCIRYETIDLMEYTVRLRYYIKGVPALERDCPSCNKINSLQIIDL